MTTPPRQHDPHSDAPRGLRRPGALITQTVGIIVSVALLVWSASLALAPENRASLERLASAPAWAIAALVALVLCSVFFNGLIFQTVLAHRRRLGVLYLTAVTGIATLVAYAPFKLSLIVRALIHRRRDAMPYKALVAWFAATAGLSLCVIAPATLASAWRPQLDALWAALAFAAPALLLTAAVVVARRVRTIPTLHTLTLGSADYATSPVRVANVAVVRYLDLAAMTLRFHLAASVLGIELSAGAALVAASVYFLTGLLSPSGNLGAREGAVTTVGFLPAIANHEQMALVALTVTAAEIVGALIAGTLGALYIRPDRLLRAQPAPPTETSSSDELPDR